MARHFQHWRSRFLDEARALAQLDALSSMARVIDFFSENGTAYLVMPWIEGKPLSEQVRQHGPLTSEALLRMLWPLLDGLAALHRLGLIHRDIKPENLLIDSEGKPVLIDFGNCASLQILHSQVEIAPALSDCFAAPEQYANEGRRMGPWTDLFAVGALIHYALLGKRPPKATDLHAGQALPALPPSTPDALRQAALRCMAMQVHERPQTVAELQSLLAPLRQTQRTWLQALPNNATGRRLQALQQRATTARRPSWHTPAALAQGFWLAGQGLWAAFAVHTLVSLLVLSAILLMGSGWEALPLGLLLTWALGALPCGLLCSRLQFRRIAALGGSLPLQTEPAWQAAQERLQQVLLMQPLGLLAGLLLPLGALSAAYAVAEHEAGVQERVARALADPAREALERRILEWQSQTGIWPTGAEADAQELVSSEITEVDVAPGRVRLKLGVSGAGGRSLALEWQGGRWVCTNLDLKPQHLPAACRTGT